MSRCFPFPPPGYEKKPRSDDIDLLAKEKHKEKEQKKEKRDREQRECKERKDKDRSRDKHKEKKDEKEKHREKKRDKDGDRKKRTEDDKKTKERTKGHNEEEIGCGSWKAEEVKNSKFIEEFGRRIKDEGAAETLLENFTGSVQKGNFGASIALEKDRCNRNEMATNLIAQEPRRNDALGQAMEMDANKKIEGKKKAKDRYEMLAKLINKEQRKNDSMGRIVEKDVLNNVEAKEKVKDRYGMVENVICKEQRIDDKMCLAVEKDADEKFEGKGKRDDAGEKVEEKDKITDREANIKKGDKRMHRGQEKGHKGKVKYRHKEKEKEKKKKREKGEKIHKERDKPKDSGQMDWIDNLTIMPLAPWKSNEKFAGTDGTVKKRKDFEINGFFHEIDGLPNKLPRSAPSSHPHVENGRTLGSCHVATRYSPIKIGITKYIDAERVPETKECKINSIEEPPSMDDLRPLVALESSPNGKASVKPPHPDTKFLSQVYSIPKMEEWPECDDQYWLFGGDPLRPKPRATFEAEETSHVWTEGLQIESADIFALPYIIPF